MEERAFCLSDEEWYPESIYSYWFDKINRTSFYVLMSIVRQSYMKMGKQFLTLSNICMYSGLTVKNTERGLKSLIKHKVVSEILDETEGMVYKLNKSVLER